MHYFDSSPKRVANLWDFSQIATFRAVVQYAGLINFSLIRLVVAENWQSSVTSFGSYYPSTAQPSVICFCLVLLFLLLRGQMRRRNCTGNNCLTFGRKWLHFFGLLQAENNCGRVPARHIAFPFDRCISWSLRNFKRFKLAQFSKFSGDILFEACSDVSTHENC